MVWPLALSLLLLAGPALAQGAKQSSLDVTTLNDAADGDTTSVTTLIASPGADGAVSLREAITAANNTAGTVVVGFAVTGEILPLSTLPAINGAGSITLEGAGEIVLNGENLSQGEPGLEILSGGNIVEGLTIKQFPADGVRLTGEGAVNNQIRGCLIGTDGQLALGNGGWGVKISNGASNNTVGSTDAAVSTVVSGNVLGNIGIAGSATQGNSVVGCYIGLSADGQSAVRAAGAATSHGIAIEDGASNNAVGALDAGSTCFIAGNGGSGVVIRGAGTMGNRVVNCLIGIRADGLAALPNTGSGVVITDGAQDNSIGDPLIAGNVISGNGADGVLVEGGATLNRVQLNRIGLAPEDGAAAEFGNAGAGIRVTGGVANILIGGTAAAGETANTIAYNGGPGIAVEGNEAATTGVEIRRNSIHANAGGGITLEGDANGQQPAPLLFRYDRELGLLEGTAPAGAVVDVFAGQDDQGELFLGEVVAGADAFPGSGYGNFQLNVGILDQFTRITATATEIATKQNGDSTSEFSAPLVVREPTAAACGSGILPQAFHELSAQGVSPTPGAAGEASFTFTGLLSTTAGNGGILDFQAVHNLAASADLYLVDGPPSEGSTLIPLASGALMAGSLPIDFEAVLTPTAICDILDGGYYLYMRDALGVTAQAALIIEQNEPPAIPANCTCTGGTPTPERGDCGEFTFSAASEDTQYLLAGTVTFYLVNDWGVLDLALVHNFPDPANLALYLGNPGIESTPVYPLDLEAATSGEGPYRYVFRDPGQTCFVLGGGAYLVIESETLASPRAAQKLDITGGVVNCTDGVPPLGTFSASARLMDTGSGAMVGSLGGAVLSIDLGMGATARFTYAIDHDLGEGAEARLYDGPPLAGGTWVGSMGSGASSIEGTLSFSGNESVCAFLEDGFEVLLENGPIQASGPLAFRTILAEGEPGEGETLEGEAGEGETPPEGEPGEGEGEPGAGGEGEPQEGEAPEEGEEIPVLDALRPCQLICLEDEEEPVDNDGDGLSRCVEDCLGSSDEDTDTDADGMPDGFEARAGLEYLRNDSGEDLDGDTLTNIEEYLRGSSPSDPNDPFRVVFVGPNGQDSAAAGTLSRPFATVNYARGRVNPGPTNPVRIVLLPGDYVEEVFLSPHVTLSGSLDGGARLFGFVSGARNSAIEFFEILAHPEPREEFLVEIPGVPMRVNGMVLTGDEARTLTGVAAAGNSLVDSAITRTLFQSLHIGIDINGDAPSIWLNNFDDIAGNAIVVRSGGPAELTHTLGSANDPSSGWNRFFTGQIDGFVVVNERAGPLLVERNDWDTDSADEIAAAVSGDVDFEPFLAKGAAALASSLFVTVVDSETQDRVTDASVTLSPSPFNAVTKNENGTYAFPAIEEGSYTVRASSDALGSNAAQVTLAAADFKAVTVFLNTGSKKSKGCKGGPSSKHLPDSEDAFLAALAVGVLLASRRAGQGNKEG